MKVTGSLQEKNGIYQMIVRVPDINGNFKRFWGIGLFIGLKI